MMITTLAERPELQGPMWAMQDTWPEFLPNDPVGWWFYAEMVTQLPEYVLVGTDSAGTVIARAFAVPFALRAAGRGELPGRGWDQVLLWAFSDRRHGRDPDTLSAIEITVAAGQQGRGHSALMVAAMRDNAREQGLGELVAPVRPSAKHLEPDAPMAEYVRRVREDGLPYDPWLRVHVRAGGDIGPVAPASMTVTGTLAEWREWTGEPFDAEGPVRVPGALVPVRCMLDQGCAVYVEPNVWVRHRLD